MRHPKAAASWREVRSPRRLDDGDPKRPLLLSEERQIAANLYTQNLSYAQVAAFMGISPIRARDLCRQQHRLNTMRTAHIFESELSKRALTALLHGKHARKLTDKSARLLRLVEIAACYTAAEIRDERNVGPQTLKEIEWWLAKKGFTFRSPSESIADVLAKFELGAKRIEPERCDVAGDPGETKSATNPRSVAAA